MDRIIILDEAQELLDNLSNLGKLRDLNEKEYLAIDKISRDMQEIKREYIIEEHNAYIEASKRPFTC